MFPDGLLFVLTLVLGHFLGLTFLIYNLKNQSLKKVFTYLAIFWFIVVMVAIFALDSLTVGRVIISIAVFSIPIVWLIAVLNFFMNKQKK